MAGKKKGVLTVSGEWAKHLRPDGRRAFWSGERKAAQNHIESELDAELSAPVKNKRPQKPASSAKPDSSAKAGIRQRRAKPLRKRQPSFMKNLFQLRRLVHFNCINFPCAH